MSSDDAITHSRSDHRKIHQIKDGKIPLTKIQDSATIERTTNKGQIGGYASLGTDGKVPASQLPSGQGGDMEKSIYDYNDNGIVDNSEKLEGKTVSEVQEHNPKLHDNEAHSSTFLTTELDPTVDSSLKGITLTEARDHNPKSHSHPESEITNLVTDLAAKETPSGAQTKVDAHKDLTTGVHGVDTGIIAKVADVAIDANLSSVAQDAITKRHLHSNQTLLDSYTQTETNLADAVSKKHTQIHGSSDHSGTIGTPTQVGLGNVTNDAQLKRADGDINSLTSKATPISADILLIEDSAVSFAKKKITVGSLPSGSSGGDMDENYRKKGTTQYESWYTVICTMTALTTGVLTANRLYAFPFIVPKTITLDRIAINVTTAGTGNARLGIYNNSDTLGLYPNTKILDAGEISIASTGVKSITINQQLTAGLHWLVLVSNGTPTIRCHAALGILPYLGYTSSLGAEVAAVGLYVSFTYATLPTTFPTTTTTTIKAVPIPAIFVRLSA